MLSDYTILWLIILLAVVFGIAIAFLIVIIKNDQKEKLLTPKGTAIMTRREKVQQLHAEGYTVNDIVQMTKEKEDTIRGDIAHIKAINPKNDTRKKILDVVDKTYRFFD